MSIKPDELTIVLPTRNESHNILAFLNSIPHPIMLVVIDASEDSTPDLITSHRPEKTLVIKHPGSVSEARQLGAEVAQTPWLLFTDADVVFPAEYFDRLSTYDDFDLVYGPKLSVDKFTLYYKWFAIGQRLLHSMGIPAASGSNMLIRRRALSALGGFDLRLTCNEDSELAWRAKWSGMRVSFAEDLVVHARDHRRLERGLINKTLHSLARCALLYLDLMPERWRTHDWGYWSQYPKKIPGVTNQKMELDKELNPYTLFPGFGWMEGLARLISALTSPPLLAIAGIVIATQTVVKSTAWAAFILLLSVILPALYVSWLLRAGKVTSFHLDVGEERKGLLLLVLFNIILVWAVLIIAGAPDVFLMMATAGLVLGAFIYVVVTLHWKISGHCAAAGGLTALICVFFWSTIYYHSDCSLVSRTTPFAYPVSDRGRRCIRRCYICLDLLHG